MDGFTYRGVICVFCYYYLYIIIIIIIISYTYQLNAMRNHLL
jgi:hypothetical protein